MSPKKVEKKSLGVQLAEARRAYGISQEELGEAIGATGRTVSTWETNAHKPTKGVQATIEALYGWPAGTIAYVSRTGAELPPVATSFAPGRAALEGAAVERARIAQTSAETLEGHSAALEALAEQVKALQDRVSKLESARSRSAPAR